MFLFKFLFQLRKSPSIKSSLSHICPFSMSSIFPFQIGDSMLTAITIMSKAVEVVWWDRELYPVADVKPGTWVNPSEALSGDIAKAGICERALGWWFL